MQGNTNGSKPTTADNLATDSEIQQIDSENGESPPPESKLSPSDMADKFHDAHGEDYLWCVDENSWYWFNDYYWQKDTKLLVRNHIREFAKRLFGKGAELCDIENQLKTLCAINSEDFDTDPWLIATPTFTIDLKAGHTDRAKMFVHESKLRKKLITMTTRADWSNQPPKRWLQFLEEAQPDPEIRECFRLVLGSCLVGVQYEHLFLFLYGPGGSGKSTALNTIVNVLGDYAVGLSDEFLRVRSTGKHDEGVARLEKKRFAVTQEVPGASMWNWNKINALTGNDTITADMKYKPVRDFKTQFLLAAFGNERLRLPRVDKSVSDRLRLIPFLNEPKFSDPKLIDDLENEMDRIFGWLLEACFDYLKLCLFSKELTGQRSSIPVPKALQNEIEEYLESEDMFHELVGDGENFPFYLDPDGYVGVQEAKGLARMRIPNIGPGRLEQVLGEHGIKQMKLHTWLNLKPNSNQKSGDTPNIRVYGGISHNQGYGNLY